MDGFGCYTKVKLKKKQQIQRTRNYCNWSPSYRSVK